LLPRCHEETLSLPTFSIYPSRPAITTPFSAAHPCALPKINGIENNMNKE
jgi:hypothetical protein